MSTQIKLKRGLSSTVGSLALQAGEPAFTTDTGKLYIGNGTEKIIVNPFDKISGLDTTSSYTKVKVNEYGQVVSLATLAISDLPTINVSDVKGLGSAALANTGIESGNVPILDNGGKLNTSVLPSLAITDTYVVANQAEMLALNAETGDIAVRTDSNENYILKASPASIIGNWVKLLVPIDAVSSVNGKAGAVVLISTDLLMTGYTKAQSYSPITTSDNSSVAIGKLEKNFDSYAPLASPSFTGAPLSTTPVSTDNSTKIATTAYVQSNLAVIDGGTF
ncbi:MAG: hypothetical protein RSB67_00495 [Clostridia bacterium]